MEREIEEHFISFEIGEIDEIAHFKEMIFVTFLYYISRCFNVGAAMNIKKTSFCLLHSFLNVNAFCKTRRFSDLTRDKSVTFIIFLILFDQLQPD